MSPLSLLLPLAVVLLSFELTTIQASNFTATFFFGDSTLDTGNNKFISTAFQGNHPPYGFSFPNQSATGRFSNGLLVPDLLSSALGVKQLSPPYLDPSLSDQEIVTGVNFASAGSGYDDMTSSLSNTVAMTRQVEMFEEYVRRLKGVVGEEEGRGIVGGALMLFSAGGNDMIFNFYDLPRRRAEFDVGGYQDFLHGKLMDAVKRVHSLGGRKFIIAGLPPMGCLPIQLTASFKLDRCKCVEDQMSDTIAYNSKLRNLLPSLQQSLPGSKIAYLDITDNVVNIIKNPRQHGFEEAKKGCCGSGYVELGPLCNKWTPICKKISSFLFFDAIHPSEKMYKIVTNHIMNDVIPQLY